MEWCILDIAQRCYKTLISIALFATVVLSANGQAATTLTFSDNTNPANPFPGVIPLPGTGMPYTTAFSTAPFSGSPPPAAEYRLIAPEGGAAGAGEKNGIDGGEAWTFNKQGAMTGTIGLPGNPGQIFSPTAAPDPDTNPALFQYGSPVDPRFAQFIPLAPAVGTLAGDAYGAGQLTLDFAGNSIEIFFPVLDSQWVDSGIAFLLGTADQDGDGLSDGVTFRGDLFNVVTNEGVTSFDFSLFGEHLIDSSEDYNNNIAGFLLQWELHGSGGEYVVPVPAAVWLFSSGVLGLIGISRRKKTA